MPPFSPLCLQPWSYHQQWANVAWPHYPYHKRVCSSDAPWLLTLLTEVQVLITSQLDYCNAVFAALPAGQMSWLQSVRVAARFVLQLPGRALVSSAMHSLLRWLNFPQRITYKLCLLNYKCLSGFTPDHRPLWEVYAPDCLTRTCVLVATVDGRSWLWYWMTINCSSHGQLQSPLIRASSAPNGILHLLCFVIDLAVTLRSFRHQRSCEAKEDVVRMCEKWYDNMQPGWCQPVRQEFMGNECEALPGAYPGVRDNRSTNCTINTKTGYDDDDDLWYAVVFISWHMPLWRLLRGHLKCLL